jgi:hypothetical protein
MLPLHNIIYGGSAQTQEDAFNGTVVENTDSTNKTPREIPKKYGCSNSCGAITINVLPLPYSRSRQNERLNAS